MAGSSLLPVEFSMFAAAPVSSETCCEALELLFAGSLNSYLSGEALHDAKAGRKSAKRRNIHGAPKANGRPDLFEEEQFSVVASLIAILTVTSFGGSIGQYAES